MRLSSARSSAALLVALHAACMGTGDGVGMEPRDPPCAFGMPTTTSSATARYTVYSPQVDPRTGDSFPAEAPVGALAALDRYGGLLSGIMGGTGDRDEPLTYVWCSRDAVLPGYPPENDRLREGLIRTDNPFAVRHAIESALFGYGDPPWWLSAGLTEQLVGFSGFHQAPLRPEPAGTHGRFLLQPVSAEADVLAHDVAEARREAAAFVGWLMKRWGEVPLRELFKTARAVEHGALAEPHPAEDDDFAAVYGISLSEALDLWQDEVGDVDIERRRLNTLACATSVPVPLDENSEARVTSRFERLSDPAPPFEYWRPGLNEGHAFVVSQDSTLTVDVEATRRSRISIEGCFAPLQDGDVGAILEPVGTGVSASARLTAEVRPGTWIVRVGQYAERQVDELPAYSLHVRLEARVEDLP